MPQLFPMNWLLLSLSLFIIIYFELTLIYFLPFFKKSSFLMKKNVIQKNWKW
uniref:ATP synthase F0 subunit 8 n=1 Tax=Argas ricei TaxID=2944766 RepID=UPI002237AD52|nr:ATP synthase F0 subunit 8 [Argas ricei]UYB77979.1 ATP synthase F0 subunit 8 [Argas sp. San Antonio ARK-2022a]UYB77992.1 ATP synthase F0 subunit 8 [Argas ricei]